MKVKVKKKLKKNNNKNKEKSLLNFLKKIGLFPLLLRNEDTNGLLSTIS